LKPVSPSFHFQQLLAKLEYFSKLVSRNAKFVIKNLKLTNKKTGQVIHFPVYDEKALVRFRNNRAVMDFDMSKLEVEYDYETDSEQIVYSKKMLLDELF
jgi:bifunctional pyridoxal-dependent enzyme with beta-cystathionase and maltose regulon repressor activities